MEQIAKYIYEVYKQKSFTAAAKSLFISQPALSSAVSRFEKEIKFRIFDRSKVPLTLTPQGRAYIDMVEEMIESENAMLRRIKEIDNPELRSISVGIKGYTSYFISSAACGAFYKQYPDINVSLQIGNTGRENILFEKLANDEIDLLFSHTTDSNFISMPIYSERFVIAVHKNTAGAEKLAPFALTWQEIITRQYDQSKLIIDTSIFKGIPFITFSKLSYVYKVMENILGEYRSAPYKIRNSRQAEMHYNLMCAGIGAVMTTETVIAKTHHDSNDILYFVPKSEESFRTIYLLRKQHSEQNPAVQKFIKVTKDICKPEIMLSPDIYIK